MQKQSDRNKYALSDNETLSKFLAINLAYYIKDVKKRCVDGYKCAYSGETIGINTEGCFIGRMLPSKDRIKADKYFEIDGDASSVKELIEDETKIGIELPNVIKQNQGIMRRFQSLHDININWNSDTGLSELGKIELKDIIVKFDLIENDFKKFL